MLAAGDVVTRDRRLGTLTAALAVPVITQDDHYVEVAELTVIKV